MYMLNYDIIYTASDSQNRKTVSSHMYTILAWMNLPEFVMVITAAFNCYVFAVRKVLLTVVLSLLLSLVIALFVVSHRTPLLIFTMLSRSLVATDKYLLVQLVSLLYPTEIRSIGTGTCVSVGRIGIILGPFIFETWFAKNYFYGIVFNIAILSASFIATIPLMLHK